METIWFVIVAFMIMAYAVLDGFDIGVGILHWLVAKNDGERRTVFEAIGPFWNGNEVWLIAAGGTLYFAFPAMYASSFSGFYLPLMMVLWLLILRGISIEFRSQLESEVWRTFFDFTFSVASVLLAIFLGAALGNIIRGVPLDAEGVFFEPLWTNFRIGEHNGILDWYTVMTGVVALLALALHGAIYLGMKTTGPVRDRSRALAMKLWWAVGPLSIVTLAATQAVLPNAMAANDRPILWLFPFIVGGGLLGLYYCVKREKDLEAFLCSCLYLAGMLGGAACATYPYLLPSSTNPAYSLTIYNTATSQYGLRIGLFWFPVGLLLVTAYFSVVYRIYRGRVTAAEEGVH
jgi:cytochrome d ubiquinol oxidase subunit II